MDEKTARLLEASASQHEDAALKISMQFFADELLPYFGISGKVAAIAPTELVHLEAQKFLQAGSHSPNTLPPDGWTNALKRPCTGRV